MNASVVIVSQTASIKTKPIVGYVLDGFPSLCEDWLSMKEQLELIKNWKYKPDFIINLKVCTIQDCK